MGAVVSFISDVFESVVDAVGDVVEAVGDIVEKAVEFVGDTVQAILDDPLPTLLSIAGTFVGIPPYITSAAITAARGGDLMDIALSAGTAYLAPTATNAISSTLSTAIGDSIINQTVSDAVVGGISKGLVNGTLAEIRGGDFDDGFAGAFTGSLVSAGVTELSGFVQPEIASLATDLGFDQSTVNQITNIGTKAVTAGVTSEITGRNDFATAFTNSVLTSTTNLAANSAANTVADTINGEFATSERINIEILGEDNETVVDQGEVKTSLADAWSNRDINTVNALLAGNSLTAEDTRTMFDLTDDDMDMLAGSGIRFNAASDDIQTTTDLTSADTNDTIGTGAGIPDSLVAEVIVSGYNNSEDTGTASDVISDAGDTYFSNDLGGSDSVATISGSKTQSVSGDTQDTVSSDGAGWLDLSGYEDVADIAETVGDDSTVADAGSDEEAEDASLAGLPEGFDDIVADASVAAPTVGMPATEPIDNIAGDTVAKTTKPFDDSYEGLDVGLDVTSDEDKPVDIAGLNTVNGGLNSLTGQQSLTQDTGTTGKTILAGALNQFLKPAIRQDVTKALFRPVTRQPVRKVTKPPAKKTILTPEQVMAMRKPATTVAAGPTTVNQAKPGITAPPKKVDVSKLTPVTNIASLTSLLANKKG